MDRRFEQVSHFLLELYRETQTLPPQRFQEKMLSRVGDILPYDYAAWGGGEADSRDVTEVIVLNQSQELLTLWPQVGPLDRFCDLTLRHMNKTWNFDDIPNYRDTLAYNEHWRTFDVEHMMSTIVSEPVDGYVTFLGLFHEDSARPFTETDRAMKQMLMPHLSQALRLNRWHTVNNENERSPEEGSAIINRNGWILESREPFMALVREEWANVSAFRMPEAFLKAIKETEDWHGNSIQIQAKRFGEYFLLRVQPRSPLDLLAPRAQQVAVLYAEGHSHKEVARQLGIAPDTARKHIAAIYERLGISSKAALVQLIRHSKH